MDTGGTCKAHKPLDPLIVVADRRWPMPISNDHHFGSISVSIVSVFFLLQLLVVSPSSSRETLSSSLVPH